MWNFGDGNHALGQLVHHIYTQSGNYTLSLTVASPTGGKRTVTRLLAVGLPISYDNPYRNHPISGTPPQNARVVLPTSTPRLSDHVGTVADAQHQGPIKQVLQTTQGNGPTLVLWGSMVLAAILLGILLTVCRKRLSRAV